MGGADLFRAGYSHPSVEASIYTSQPVTRLVMAEMKAQLDARQSNGDSARSLEAFFRQHDKGYGAVRVEDFKAGLALGGVQVSPSQMHSIKGSFGNPDGTIRWQDMLEAMDLLGHEQGLSIVMTHKMGPATARHMGYMQGNPVMRGYLHHASRAQSMKNGSGGGALLSTATLSPNSLMRTSNIKPVVQPPSDSPKGTFNVTSVTNASVTQRHKSQTSTSLRATLERISGAAEASADLASTLKELDQGVTGCVTLDAFLTACARAGLTLRPDELDVLRQSGLLRRPYDAAPELIDYNQLEIGA